jgi:hypothetical protein
MYLLKTQVTGKQIAELIKSTLFYYVKLMVFAMKIIIVKKQFSANSSFIALHDHSLRAQP